MVIVIPIYKDKLDRYEGISLAQVRKILGNYSIVFAAPETLEFNYGKTYEVLTVERFSDYYFYNTETYSELLLETSFYQRFEEYKYMLIYQLDAFVFSDRLEEFCDLGYDYIGAPIAEGDWMDYHVGNGGLSLRKISSTIELLKHKDEIMTNHPLETLFKTREDNFFAYCGYKKEIAYSVPSVFIAATFSAQNDVGHGLRDIPKRGLPFGTHHWPTHNYKIWKPYIEQYGYRLPEVSEGIQRDYLLEDLEKRKFQFILYYLRHHQEERDEIVKAMGFSDDEDYVIRGAGFWGKRCAKILKRLSLSVAYFCDQNAHKLKEYDGIRILDSSIDNMIGKVVIISIENQMIEKEIKGQLEAVGMKEGSDYLNYFKMISLLERYVKSRVSPIHGITVPINMRSDGEIDDKCFNYYTSI